MQVVPARRTADASPPRLAAVPAAPQLGAEVVAVLRAVEAAVERRVPPEVVAEQDARRLAEAAVVPRAAEAEQNAPQPAVAADARRPGAAASQSRARAALWWMAAARLARFS